MAQLVGHRSSHRPKGHWFDTWSGHMSGLWVWSLVAGGVQKAADGRFSLASMFLSLSPSLPLSLK